MDLIPLLVLIALGLTLFVALTGGRTATEKKKPTENDILDLGFDFLRQYEHDDWKTQIFEKGCMQVEFTRNKTTGKLDSLEIELINPEIDRDLESIKKLDKLLNG